MAAPSLGLESKGILRTSTQDVLLIVLAVIQSIVVIRWPSLALIAIGIWWNSNTISHNFIHRPFFRSRSLNRSFSAYLSLLTGVPQTLWRDCHFAHHAGAAWRLRASRDVVVEVTLVLGFWTMLAVSAPAFFLTTYVTGYAIGLTMCWLHGYYEHKRGTTSHYGWLYNALFFNDGYHIEHHAHPLVHWSRLPELAESGSKASRWPPSLRWLDAINLETLERIVMRSRALRCFYLRSHRRAIAALLPHVDGIRRVVIVGGGLYPRTAILLRELLPKARITILDASRENLDIARSYVDAEFAHRSYSPGEPLACDLAVIPLALHGDREAVYRFPPCEAVLVHDWIWRRRGTSRVVSVGLLKRVNLVRRPCTQQACCSSSSSQS